MNTAAAPDAQQQGEWNQESLAAFLKSKGVGASKTAATAQLLIKAGYTTETELLAATESDLRAVNVGVPVMRLILKASAEISKAKRQRMEIPILTVDNDNDNDNQAVIATATATAPQADINAAMQKQIDRLAMKESKAVSFADYYNEKNEEGRIVHWVVAPATGNPPLPAPIRNVDALPRGAELVAIKPFWKGVVETSTLVANISNGYEVGVLGVKKPDIAFYSLDVVRPTAGEYIGYGDCKGEDWSGTSITEKGQAMLYGHRILDAQPQRLHVYGFLTNNERTVLVKTHRSQNRPYKITWDISDVQAFSNGMKTFFRLLKNDNGFLIPPTVNNNLLSIISPLRPGGTCRAFVAKYQEEQVVAKLYSDDSTSCQDRDNIIRTGAIVAAAKSANSMARVPTVRASEGLWLLIQPVGRAFTPERLTLYHITMLVATLKTVHTANVFHRDVRFANIFVLEDGSVLLNDWGSSVLGGRLELVAGCPEPWCHPELRKAVQAVPLAKHDLYSLVASAAELIAPGLDFEGRLRLFEDAITASERSDYDGVVEGMRKAGLR